MTASADSLSTYREMLKLDPGSRIFAFLAEELCASGMWEEAAEVCRKGLTVHPDHLRARVLLGWALMELGEADESEQALQGVVDDFRKNSIIFKMLSEFAVFSGNPDRANEFSRMYEAFHDASAAPTQAPPAAAAVRVPEPEIAKPKPVEPAVEAMAAVVEPVIEEPAIAVEPAVEEVAGKVEAAVEKMTKAAVEPEISDLEKLVEQAAEGPKEQLSGAARMEKLLNGLAVGLDKRLSQSETAPDLFSEADRDFLKKFTLSAVGADSPS